MAAKGLAALAIGLGNGYMKAERQGLEDQRQARLDQMRQEEHDIRLDAYKRDNEMRQVLADATKPATLEGGYRVTDAAGSDAHTFDPDAAMALGDMARTKNTGMDVTGSSDIRLNRPIGGAQVFTDPEQAKISLAAYNKPEAQQQRMVEAASKVDPLKGITLESGLIDRKIKQMGLTKAQYDFADYETNRQLDKILSNSPTWHEGYAQVLTDTNVGGVAGMKVSSRVSGDGKTVDFMSTAPDGSIRTIASFPNTKDGEIQARQRVTSAPFETKTSWLIERDKAEKGAAAAAAKEVREDRRLDQNDRRLDNDSRKTDAILAKVASGGRLDGEERKRVTTLFTDASRQLDTAQKALNTLTAGKGSFMFMTQAKVPGTPEHAQLEDAKLAIKRYTEERSTYQQLLAGQIASGSPSQPSNPTVKTLPAGAKQIGTSGGKPVYQTPDGKKFIAQ